MNVTVLLQDLVIREASLESGKARALFQKYAAALAYIEVQDQHGDFHIGSAFHVGEGVFVTARHVLDGYTVTKVGSTERAYIRLSGQEAQEATDFFLTPTESWPIHYLDNGEMETSSGPHFHSDERADVAVFKVAQVDPRTPVIRLGANLDNFIDRSELVLTEAIVLGYPRIPMSSEAILMGARAEVNALAGLYHAPYDHFVLSAMPRGGFSGGVAISEYDVALGVVTSSLVPDNNLSEFGFMAVLGVDPIYIALSERGLLPGCQVEGWAEPQNSRKVWFDHPEVDASGRTSTIMASVELFDDGGRVARALTCMDDPALLQALVELAHNRLADCTLIESEPRPGLKRIDVYSPGASAGQQALTAARAVVAELRSNDYVPKIPGLPGSEDLLLCSIYWTHEKLPTNMQSFDR
jgi:hypothetical protein